MATHLILSYKISLKHGKQTVRSYSRHKIISGLFVYRSVYQFVHNTQMTPPENGACYNKQTWRNTNAPRRLEPRI